MEHVHVFPNYNANEGRGLLRPLDRKGILHVAQDKLSLPFHARSMLHENLVQQLTEEGVPAAMEFLGVMEEHKAVISGSFVTSFVDPDFVRSWTAPYSGPGDVDVYVGRGRLEQMLLSLEALPGAEMSILQLSTRPVPETDEDGHVHHGPRDDVIYNNTAIDRMARLCFENEHGSVGYMDVMESISASPIMPIARFDLTHLCRGISSEGYFDLHPNWHTGRKTFTSIRVTGGTETDGEHSNNYFVRKYQERGYNVILDGVVTGTTSHECAVSTDCPLTLRRTDDDGVFFVPFTDVAAIRASIQTPNTLRDPIVYWKHGGRCDQSGDQSMDSVLYDEEGVSAENREMV